MNIGIFGDSYAFDDNQDSWVNLLRLKGCTIKSYGTPGTSLWYSFDNFIKNYIKYDTIVFCYTSKFRTQLMPKNQEMFSGMFNTEKYKEIKYYKLLTAYEKEMLEKIKDVHFYVENKDFNLWINQKIFDDVNNICLTNKLKLVNILPFESNQKSIDFKNASGTCITHIYEVTAKESDICKINVNEPDVRPCHLTKHNNKILSDIVYESLQFPNKNLLSFVDHPKIKYICDL